MGIQQISADEVKKILDLSTNCIILDVRTIDEYKRGSIEKSIHIPLHMLEPEVENKLPDKNAQIIVYCLSGSRSSEAAEILDYLGYSHIQNMTSGLLAWRAKGYPLVMP